MEANTMVLIWFIFYLCLMVGIVVWGRYYYIKLKGRGRERFEDIMSDLEGLVDELRDARVAAEDKEKAELMRKAAGEEPFIEDEVEEIMDEEYYEGLKEWEKIKKNSAYQVRDLTDYSPDMTHEDLLKEIEEKEAALDEFHATIKKRMGAEK